VWQTYCGAGRLGPPGKSAAKRFFQVGKDWLSFHNKFVLPAIRPFVYDPKLKTYGRYLLVEVGLANRTVETHANRLKIFLRWLLTSRRTQLRNLTLPDVEEYLSRCASRGWRNTTIAGAAHVLKSFLRFSERRRWSTPRISWGIIGPRFSRYHTPTKGPDWPAVCALLNSFGDQVLLEKRAKAMCLLLAKFAFRSSEVIELRLGDIDFKQRLLTVRRAKNRCVQRLPMSGELVSALRNYLNSRPACDCTHVFVTLRSPHKKVSNSAMYSVIRRKIDQLGIRSLTKGAHSLRHACAERLRDRGASAEEIGSYLGHRSSKFVGDYVHHTVESLRQVAELPIRGLCDDF
jgi:site-specific recombinase XerD